MTTDEARWDLFRLIGAPAVWLERARGRRRMFLVIAYGLALAVLAGAGAWWGQLRGLPDVGDPPGAAEWRAAAIPARENAYTYYYRAIEEAYPIRPEFISGGGETPWVDQWQAAPAEQKAWLDTLRRPLAFWRRGTDCPDAIPLPGHPVDGMGHKVARYLGMFARLGALQGSKLESEGDHAAAWMWYAAALRSSQHYLKRSYVGAYVHNRGMIEAGAGPARRWAGDPTVDADLIRRALLNVAALERMTPPPADCLYFEYEHAMAWLDEFDEALGDIEWRRKQDPAWRSSPLEDWLSARPRFRLWLRRDRERSRRVARLIYANWIGEVTKPEGQRPELGGPTPSLYRITGFGVLSNRQLRAWYESADQLRGGQLGREVDLDLEWKLELIESNRLALKRIEATLAARLFRDEHGREPVGDEELVAAGLLTADE